FTVCHIAGSCTTPSKRTSGRSLSAFFSPSTVKTGALNIIIPRGGPDPPSSQSQRADQDQPVARARHATAQEDQVALGVHPHDAHVALRMARVPHLARQLLALDHARRVRARAERPGVARHRMPVRSRPPPEAVPLHHALEAAPLGRSRHPHALPRLELLHRELLAGLVALHRLHPELAQRPRRLLQACTARVTALRARRALLLLLPESELDRSVA